MKKWIPMIILFLPAAWGLFVLRNIPLRVSTVPTVFTKFTACDEAIEDAVLSKINDIWILGHLDLARIDEISRWAETLQNPCVKAAYKKWLSLERSNKQAELRAKAAGSRVPDPPRPKP